MRINFVFTHCHYQKVTVNNITSSLAIMEQKNKEVSFMQSAKCLTGQVKYWYKTSERGMPKGCVWCLASCVVSFQEGTVLQTWANAGQLELGGLKVTAHQLIDREDFSEIFSFTKDSICACTGVACVKGNISEQISLCSTYITVNYTKIETDFEEGTLHTLAVHVQKIYITQRTYTVSQGSD